MAGGRHQRQKRPSRSERHRGRQHPPRKPVSELTVRLPQRTTEPETVVAHLGPTNSGKTHDALRFLVEYGHGVYAAWANGHSAAVNVGVRPTFDTGRGLLIEAYLLDFSGDLYGETLRIAFAERLRGEKRFESVDELVDQMGRDVARAREIAFATVARRCR